MPYTNLPDIFLWRALAAFLLIGALAGVALALLLIFNLRFLERLSRLANRWISTRQVNRWLDRSVKIERWFYRHHRAAGAAITLGASYVLIYFGFLFDKAVAMQRQGGRLPASLLEALLDALVMGALLGGAVAFISGIIVFVRPRLLRGVEKQANRWVSLRRASKMLDVPRGQVDRYIVRHAQRAGWLLLAGSLYLLVVLLRAWA